MSSDSYFIKENISNKVFFFIILPETNGINMGLLIPNWTYNYPEFWNTVRRRNLWFIKIRYLAAVGLLLFMISGQYFFELKFSDTQIQAFILISFSIFVYNVFFQVIRQYVFCDPEKFNCMHLSLMQMIADLTALMLLVFYTGLIESPVYVFFIFHMVIGSMILPGIIIYSICVIVVSIYSILILLQRNEVIPTHQISGLYNSPVNYTLSHDIIFIIVFCLLMFMTVILANRIARNLLKREEQLRTALHKLNDAEIVKQKYIMGVVHEIKSPIAAVKSLVEVILKKFVGPISNEVEEKLKRVNVRVDESLELINNILKISKLKLLEEAHFENFDLTALIKELAEEKSDLLQNKNINLRVSYDTKKEIICYAEKDLIRLALSNIISNSIKYMENNGNILIELEEDESSITLKVIDDGIGISEKDTNKVFDQFYRGSNLNKLNTEGSGLGLSLVKEIISLHQGKISVESPSKISSINRPGTCFTIKLLKKPFEDKENEKINLISGKI
ncbi:MAG: hypothetical protein Fur0015_06800 [Ignavibacteriales bacterium]